MYPEPLKEHGIYKIKDLTILLVKGNIYQLVPDDPPKWQLIGSKNDCSLFLEDIADVEYREKNCKPRPKEMRRVYI